MRIRRLIALILSLILMCFLVACGNAEKEEENTNTTTVPQQTSSPEVETDNSDKNNSENDTKILIAYFSWSGNSKSEAELIQKETNGTLYEIAREEPYPKDYTECTEVAKKETDNNARPAIKNPLESVAEYEKIVVCYPIWWHTAPMCVGTFLENYNLSGKSIYPVSQSASMDEDQFKESVAFVKDCAKNADVKDGLFVDTNDEETITKYAKETILK